MTSAETFPDLTAFLKYESWASGEQVKESAFKLLETVTLCFLLAPLLQVFGFFSVVFPSSLASPVKAYMRQTQAPDSCCLLPRFKIFSLRGMKILHSNKSADTQQCNSLLSCCWCLPSLSFIVICKLVLLTLHIHTDSQCAKRHMPSTRKTECILWEVSDVTPA